jgi:hypothetical protein
MNTTTTTRSSRTLPSDIIRLVAAEAAQNAARDAAAAAASATSDAVAGHGSPEAVVDDIANATAAREAAKIASATWRRVPAARRAIAERIARAAENIAREAARLGDMYSGSTARRVRWATGAEMVAIGDSIAAHASTRTEAGEHYSSRRAWRKTDATHTVVLDPRHVETLVADEALRSASSNDGLRLIALAPDGRATWVTRKGQQIVAESGWVVAAPVAGVIGGRMTYHSTVGRDHAERGLRRKIAAHEAELARAEAWRAAAVERAAAEQRASSAATWAARHGGDAQIAAAAREDRRVRLIARLCHGVVATVADARDMGYCAPGIAAWQAAHGLAKATSAPLPVLVQSGNRSAIALALRLARRVAQHRPAAPAAAPALTA